MKTRLHVGVAGTGIGRQHIQAYQTVSEQFTVTAICDIDAAKVHEVAAEFTIPQVLTNFSDLCALEELDVIDICTPSYLHALQIQQALMADKHVICEKPVAGSLKELDDLRLVEARSNKRVMPIFQYRFGHGVQKLQWLKAQGLTGPAYLSTVETAWRRRAEYYAVPWRGKWETELGGALLTLAIHALDLLYYVLGPARSVFARTAIRVNPIETEDCVSASLEMGDGSLVSFSVTTGSAEQISRHRFCFQGVTAESHTAPYHNTTDPWKFTGDSPELTARISEALEWFSPLPEGFIGQFSRFYDALHYHQELPVTLLDARASLELITAIYFSAQTGQVVELPLSETHPKYTSWRPFDRNRCLDQFSIGESCLTA